MMRIGRKLIHGMLNLARSVKLFLFGQPDEDFHPTTRWQKVLLWFGIHIPRDRKDKIHIRPRFFRLLGLGFVGLLVLFIVLFEYSTSPRFCNSCHIMRPYYQAWKTSRHNFVPCVECHYPPGKRDALRVKFQAVTQVAKFVTRTYGSKPYAEVEDASCLRAGCHEARLLKGRVIFKRGIVFDHGPHLTKPRRGRRLRCTSCHSQIVVGTHMVVTESTCFLCHFKGEVSGREEHPLAGCPSCHEPPSVTIKVGGIAFNHDEFVGKRHVPCQKCHLDAIRGEGRAPMERCLACHNEPKKLEDIKDMPGLHDNHVTVHNVECSRCHEEIIHSVKTTLTPLDYGCNVCHEGKHAVQKEMFMGTGGKDFPGIPSHMFIAQVDCIACHTEALFSGEKAELSGQTYIASQKACTDCHGRQYDGMLRSWEKTFDTMLKEIKPKLASVSSVVQNARSEGRLEESVENLLANARYNVEFVDLGRGVHNVFYAAGLLHVANENLDSVMESLGEAPLSLGKHSYLGGDYCAILCHDRVGVKMPETVKVFNRSLPHKRHFYEYDIPCTECHSSESHKEVTLKPEGCADCHHGSPNDRCAGCHKLQSALYEGSFMSSVSGGKEPALMSDVVDCRGCHTEIAGSRTPEVVAKACETCHEEGYRDLLDQWSAETAALLEEVTTKLALVKSSVEKNEKERYLSQSDLEKLKTAGDIVSSLSREAAMHNITLSEQLLRKALEDLEDIENQVRSGE